MHHIAKPTKLNDMKVFKITTSKSIFFVSASNIEYAIKKANQHITDVTTTGVSPEVIKQAEYMGRYFDPVME